MQAIAWVLVGVLLGALVSRLRVSAKCRDVMRRHVMRDQVCRRRT